MALYSGVLYRANGRVLLLKRVENDAVNPGTWALPAGHIDGEETPEHCARREFLEETGGVLGEIKPLGMYGEFALFGADGVEFTPRLNNEHIGYMWADPAGLPYPLHPAVAEQVSSFATDSAETARQKDVNGYVTVQRNPISKAGVFQYSGKMLPQGDPNKIYSVLRPAEELSSAEAINSFKLLPIIDEHVMLGDGYQTDPEEKGVHGSTGEDIIFDGENILAPLRIFSKTLRSLIDAGKRGLSLGYRCKFEKTCGEFNGMPYDYIQRNIRGNHLALVNEGRCGTAVLDHHWAFDHFDLALDKEEQKTMADEGKKTETGTEKKVMGLDEISEALSTLMPFMAQVKEFMDAAGTKTDDAAAALDAEEKKKEEDDKKKAEDEAAEEEKKKGEGMDAAEIKNLKSRMDTVEKRGTKEILADVSARDRLVKEITPTIGTFDHAEMTAAEVAVYACDKLGLKPEKGSERATLDGYLAGHKKAAGNSIAFAMDSIIPKVKGDGLLAKTLNGASA